MQSFSRIVLASILLVFALIFFGALVRLTNATDACGNRFPLCNNRLIPEVENSAAWLDWGHRLTTIGASITILGAYAVGRKRIATDYPQAFQPVLACLALLVIQTALGAGTLLLPSPPTLGLLHLALAIIMLSCLVVSVVLLHYRPPSLPKSENLSRAIYGMVMMSFVVMLTGGMVVGGAGDSTCEYPICLGNLDDGHMIHLIHRLSVAGLGILLGITAWRIFTERINAPIMHVSIVILLIIYAIQVIIGAFYVLIGSEILFSTLHVLFAVILWCVALSLGTMMMKQEDYASFVQEIECQTL